MAKEIFPLEMHYDSSSGKYYPSRIFEYKKYYKPFTQEGNQAIDSLIAAGIINPNVNRDRKSTTLIRDMRNITLYPGSGWKFEQTATTRGGVVKIGRLVRETEPGQTFPNNYEIPKNIETELRNQYENIVKLEPKAAYRGRQSDLNAIFNQQARELAGAGVSSIASLRNIDGNLVDTSSNTVINRISKDRDTGADKWGDIFSGVEGGANYGVSFAADGSPIFYPVYEKGKSPLSQIGLGELEDIIAPILTIAGVFVGVPGLGPVASAALGAAGGNTIGQLLATGDVDWDEVIKASATAGVGAIGSTTYATQVGNALGATGTTATVVGNAVINSGLSGIVAATTGGNIEKSMLAGAIGGAAMAGAKEVAEAILGADNIASIASTTGLSTAQVENIFTTSVANGLVAEVQGTGEFLETVGTSLAAQGVGAKSANLMTEATAKALKDSPAIRASVITATGGIATVATNAAIQGEDVGKALENAAPGIILSSVQAGQQEADRQDELAAQREKELVAAQQPVQVAGPVSPALTDLDIALQLAEGRNESVVNLGQQDGIDSYLVTGKRDDGSTYTYTILSSPEIGIKYEYTTLPLDPISLRAIPGAAMGTSVSSEAPDFRIDSTIGVPSTQQLAKLDTAQDFGYLPSQLRIDLTQTIVRNELDRLERELQQLQESQQAFQRAETQFTSLQERGLGQELRPEVRESLEEELAGLEEEAQRAGERAGQIESERATLTGIESGEQGLSDEQLLSFLETGEVPVGITGGQREGEGEAPEGGAEAGEGEEGGAGRGEGGEGEGEGAGGEGEGEGGAGVTETRLRPSLIFDRETGGRPETTPFASRVTGEALASILGEKEPLFGGDDDEQRAVWNRRSLKLLSRALGL
jgi:hypothetical protein